MTTSRHLRRARWSIAFVALLLAGAAQAGSSYFAPPPNNGFEGDAPDGCTPEAWRPYFVDGPPGAVRGCRSADRAHSGYFSAKFVDPNGADWGGLFSVSRPIQQLGQCFQAWAWLSSPDGARGHLFLEFFDVQGNRVLDVFTGVDLGDPWQLVQTPQGCAPYNAVTVRILLYSCISCVGTWYADDVLWEIFV